MAGRVHTPVLSPSPSSPSCSVFLSDGRALLKATGIYDDWSDDSLVSFDPVGAAGIKKIGLITAMRPVSIRLALKQCAGAKYFRFCRAWVVPGTILELDARQLALHDKSILVKGDLSAAEDIVFGLLCLRHLRIDFHTLLET